MELQAYAMAAKVAHYTIMIFIRVLLYCMAYVAYKTIWLCRLRSDFETFLCNPYKLFLLRSGLSDYEHARSICIISVKYCGKVNVYDVPFL